MNYGHNYGARCTKTAPARKTKQQHIGFGFRSNPRNDNLSPMRLLTECNIASLFGTIPSAPSKKHSAPSNPLPQSSSPAKSRMTAKNVASPSCKSSTATASSSAPLRPNKISISSKPEIGNPKTARLKADIRPICAREVFGQSK